MKSEIEVADFDRLLAKIEHVPIEHQEMRTLLIKVNNTCLNRKLMCTNYNYFYIVNKNLYIS